jgi:ankyrin repeat protein
MNKQLLLLALTVSAHQVSAMNKTASQADAKAATESLQAKNALALIKAAENGDLDPVKALIAAGTPLNAKNNDGDTALHYAASFGHLEIAKVLIAADAQVNIQNEISETALLMAAARGYFEIAKTLITAGAQVDMQNCNGSTALDWAAWRGHLEIVKILTAAGADIDADKINQLPNSFVVWAAIEEGQKERKLNQE